MADFQTVAAELDAAFIRAERADGSRFWKIADDAAEWIGEDFGRLIHEAVDGPDSRLPDDDIYRVAAAAAAWIAGGDFVDAAAARDDCFQFADSIVPIYTADLMRWAGNCHNQALIQEAVEEYGEPVAADPVQRIDHTIARGFHLMADRIAGHLISAVERQAEA